MVHGARDCDAGVVGASMYSQRKVTEVRLFLTGSGDQRRVG